jgi:hypothetical protein
MRDDRMLTGAAVLVAVTAIGGAVATSHAEQATPTAQHPLVNTATVGRGRLSDMVSQYGTLTYRAGSDGSPYTVINRARGTFCQARERARQQAGPGQSAVPGSGRRLQVAAARDGARGRAGSTRSDARVREVHEGARLPDLLRPEAGRGHQHRRRRAPRARPEQPRFQQASEACGGPGEGDTDTQTSGGAP